MPARIFMALLIIYLTRCVREAPAPEDRGKTWVRAESAERSLLHEESRTQQRDFGSADGSFAPLSGRLGCAKAWPRMSW